MYLKEYSELGHNICVFMSQSGEKRQSGVPHCHTVSPVLQQTQHCLLPVVTIQVKERQPDIGENYTYTS